MNSRYLPFLVIAAFVAIPVAATIPCTDWWTASPVPVSVSWGGTEFLDTQFGDLGEGFLLKWRTEWSGTSFSHTEALFDVRDVNDPNQVWTRFEAGGIDGPGGSIIESCDGARCVLYISTNYGPYYRSLVSVTASGPVEVNLPLHGPAEVFADRVFQAPSLDWGETALGYIDVSDPASPVILGQLQGAVRGKPWAMNANCALVFALTGLQYVDFSDPAFPLVRSSDPVSGYFNWLGRAGDLVVFSGSSGTYAVDSSNPDSIAVAWSLPERATALTVQGHMAVMSFGSSNPLLQVYDLSAGTPVPVGAPFGAGTSALKSLVWWRETVYTGTGPAWNLVNIEAPSLIGTTTSIYSRIYVEEESLISASGIFPLHCGPVTTVQPVGSTRFDLVAVPNPFNPQTEISFNLAEAAKVRLSVYDYRGMKVRTLVAGLMGEGPQRLIWDGRDDEGNGVASGAYIVRLFADREFTTTKLTLLE